jgi:hypothetical protein
MKKTILALLLLLLLAPFARAVEPIEINNKFGIHLAVPDDKDLLAAKNLVNSAGGRWGYVTIVVQDNDLDQHKWRAIFDKLRKWQLIPIVRLATHPNGGFWEKPEKSAAKKWGEFLNSLNWVSKNRYVVLFNEPNHASEWGNEVNPEEYAQTALYFAKELKKANPNYYLLLAGLDQAAPQQLPNYASASWFLQTVIDNLGKENFEKYFDGWCSHSYPNPGFSASPYNQGWGSIRGYESELQHLQTLGIKKDLPVFITETGWERRNLNEELVAQYLTWAYSNVWLPDSRVVAVTPFLLNYQSEPFLDFSWQKLGQDSFYPQYEAIMKMPKVAGQPKKEEKIIFEKRLPKKLVEDSHFVLPLAISNRGQGYWDYHSGYELKIISEKNYAFRFLPLNDIAPSQTGVVNLKMRTPTAPNNNVIRVGLYDSSRLVAQSPKWSIKIVPLKSLAISYQLLSFVNSGSNFKVLLYDQQENIVFEASNLEGKKGKILVPKIRSVALGEKYRLVLLKPGYLPRQTFVTFTDKNVSEAKIKLMLPLDFNNDGKLSIKDLIFWRR